MTLQTWWPRISWPTPTDVQSPLNFRTGNTVIRIDLFLTAALKHEGRVFCVYAEV